MFFVARSISPAMQHTSQSCSSGGIGRIGGEVHMNKQDNNDYVVLFGRAKISKRTAKKIGFALICGFVGALISIGVIGRDNKIAALVVAAVFTFIGYFRFGKKPSGK
jgi:hypothetical protein